jgi:curved DNA-binding protein CbpA
VIFAWTKEDYEIFNINDKLKKDLGDQITFYSWLNLTRGSKSSYTEITKAYRKKSRSLHPDKFSKSSRSIKKKAEERFQLLSVVGDILKNHDLKQRYDFFLDKGFPTWKGTGFYYSKYRPGLIITFFFLFLLVSGLHYIALKINRSQDVKRIESMKLQIKSYAWNDSLIPPADGSDKKISTENGKVFVVKADGSVWLETEDGLVMMDENDINVDPGFKETLLFKFPSFLWNKTIGKWTNYTINTEVTYENPDKQQKQQSEQKKPQKKKTPKGKKIELPNGKVVYSRPNKNR